MSTFAADRLLGGLLRSFSSGRRRFKHLLIAAGVALVLLALARPQYGFTWRETPARGIDVLFVLDSSKSMLAQDIRPNRLERAKFAILDFVEKIQGDRVGLVAFAGNAFLQCPLTLDYDAFDMSLKAVDTNVISHGGTDIARALAEAENAFSANNNHKVVVLITDGEDLEQSGVDKARQLAKDGMTIYTVGVGTPEGELIPIRGANGQVEYLRDSDGKPVTTHLDEETLKEIAQATGGFYVPLGTSGYGLEQVYEAGLKSIPDQDLGSHRQRIGLERFQWPLGLAIFLLAWEPLVGTRRLFLRQRARKLAGLKQAATLAVFFVVAAWILPSSAQAQSGNPAVAPAPIPAQPAPGQKIPVGQDEPDTPEAETPPPVVIPPNANPAKLYRSGNYAAAAQLYAQALEANPTDTETRYNLGNSLYAQGQYEAARQAYEQALAALDLKLQADAFYNLGNSSYQLGKAALADTAPAPEIQQANETAFAQTQQALDTGNDILKRAEPNRVPAALRNEQTQQSAVPQQEIQQAIQQAEQAKQATTAAQEQSQLAATAGESSTNFWQQALDEYRSSLELAPDSTDASHNRQLVERKLTQQQAHNEEFTKAAERHAENTEVLDMMIEELKKLLEQDQQDQNQDQQNQDQQNQDQQQNDQQQSQDQQQQNDNQQQQDQQNNQQSNSDSSQQQNQDQSQQNQQNSGQQDQQNSQNQNQDQQSGQDDQQQQNEKSEQDQSAEQQQSGDEEQPDQQDSQKPDEQSAGEDQSEQNEDKGEEPGEDESAQGKDEQQPQSPEQEQPGQDQQGSESGQQPQDEKGPSESGLSEEQLQELSEQVAQEQSAAQAGEKGGDEKAAAAAAAGEATGEEKDVRRVPGVMTREEARLLLDALKKDDKKLPSLYVPRQYNVDDEGKRKDW
nr:VWA domain-containing protein [Ruficoccus amylovorans]